MHFDGGRRFAPNRGLHEAKYCQRQQQDRPSPQGSRWQPTRAHGPSCHYRGFNHDLTTHGARGEESISLGLAFRKKKRERERARARKMKQDVILLRIFATNEWMYNVVLLTLWIRQLGKQELT